MGEFRVRSRASAQKPAGRSGIVVRRARAVVLTAVALAALAIAPAAQAIDGFENIGAGYFSPSASTLGISGDGPVWAGAADGSPDLHMVRGHRPDGGKGPNISGTLIDAAFSCTAPGLSSARDWAEVGGGVRLPAWNNGAVTASVTASITPNQTTTYVARLGVVQAF